MSLLCWSGGLDSSLVLHQIAVEQRDGTKAHPHGIRALTIHHTQISMCGAAADKARKALAEKFRRSGLNINYLDVTVEQSAKSWRTENFLGSCDNPQALLWLTVAANYLERDEDLYSGYIRTDDYWHSANRYQAAFEALQAVAGRTGRLVHPLEWETKADVIRSTKELQLHDLCWWCEKSNLKPKRGTYAPCGVCKSCQTHATGEWFCERFPKKDGA